MEVNGTLIIQIVIFLGLLLFLSKNLFDPLLALFEERQKRIVGAKEESEEMLLKAKEKAQEFEEKYNLAKMGAKKELASLKLENDREIRDFLDGVKIKAKEKLRAAEDEIKKEEALLKGELKKSVSSLKDEIIKGIAMKKGEAL